MVINFGKYTGCTTEWVWANDRSYAEWMIRTESDNPYFMKARAEFVWMKEGEAGRAYTQYNNRYQRAHKDDFDSSFNQADFEELLRKMNAHRFGQQQSRYQAPPRQNQAQKKCWWDELGVKVNDPVATVKTAYRRLAAKYHPDRNNEPDAAEKMKRVNVAYQEAMKGR